jgi:hypothetical protein
VSFRVIRFNRVRNSQTESTDDAEKHG